MAVKKIILEQCALIYAKALVVLTTIAFASSQ
jgi:hypothetical protein